MLHRFHPVASALLMPTTLAQARSQLPPGISLARWKLCVSGLCTCCSLCMGCSSPEQPQWLFSLPRAFRSLRCPPIREAFSDKSPRKRAAPLPTSCPLTLRLVLQSTDSHLTCYGVIFPCLPWSTAGALATSFTAAASAPRESGVWDPGAVL